MRGLRRSDNVVYILYLRTIGSIPPKIKCNMGIIRRLLESDDIIYKRVWDTRSTQHPILCEDGKLYLENYSLCLTLHGKDGIPSQLYLLPKTTAKNRIVDAAVYSGPVYNLTGNEPKTYYKPFFVSLSADNWLRSYDSYTGKQLQNVYIGPPSRLKYQHCDWEIYGKRLVLTSSLNPMSQFDEPGQRKCILATLAVFTVLPLEFVGLLEINRDLVGLNAYHVNVSDGMLVIGTGGSNIGSIKLYDFTEVLNHCTRFRVRLNEPCDLLDGAAVGSCPAGLPLNCKMESLPNVLFEVKCFNHIVNFGGYPWCYVISPPSSEGVFKVYQLENDALTENGRINMATRHFEPDTIIFHGDNSGRLIYKSGHSRTIFHIDSDPEGKIVVRQRDVLSFRGSGLHPDTPAEFRERRWAFRQVTLSTSSFAIVNERSILAEDFDDDMDFYAVLGFDPCDPNCEGRIVIFDNLTWQNVKTIELGIKLDEMNDYSLFIELDKLVVIEKNANKVSNCYVYSLKRYREEEADASSSKKRKRKIIKKRK